MVWKSIPGFEGRYEVSDTGLVRSIDRWISPRDGNKPYFLRGRILKQVQNRRRYFKVNLYKENKETTREVHVLVMAAFVGPRPKGHEVRHLDGTRTNNNLSNLVYSTLSQNQQDRFKHGTACTGHKHPQCKLTDIELERISDEYSKGNFTMRQLADKYDVYPSTIWRVVNGHRRFTNGKKIRIKDRNISRTR